MIKVIVTPPQKNKSFVNFVRDFRKTKGRKNVLQIFL